MEWLNGVFRHADVLSRTTTIFGLVQAARSGIGIAPLPMSIASEAGLIEVLAPIPELERTWKLLTIRRYATLPGSPPSSTSSRRRSWR